jgi:hypothetical protein
MIPAPDFVFASTSKSVVPSDFINLKASNGRVILTSEPYQKERGAPKRHFIGSEERGNRYPL